MTRGEKDANVLEPLQDDTCFIYITSRRLIPFLIQVLLPPISKIKELRLRVVAKLVQGHTMGASCLNPGLSDSRVQPL